MLWNNNAALDWPPPSAILYHSFSSNFNYRIIRELCDNRNYSSGYAFVGKLFYDYQICIKIFKETEVDLNQPRILYLVHIHTPKMDHYAVRDSLENAQEELFQYAQGNWSIQFPGVERPKSKTEVINRYFQAVQDTVCPHVIDIESEGNWVMEDSSLSNLIPFILEK